MLVRAPCSPILPPNYILEGCSVGFMRGSVKASVTVTWTDRAGLSISFDISSYT